VAGQDILRQKNGKSEHLKGIGVDPNWLFRLGFFKATPFWCLSAKPVLGLLPLVFGPFSAGFGKGW
jgi:hypothetical protein